MKKLWSLGIFVAVGSLMMLFGGGIAGADGPPLGADVAKGFSCGVGGGVDRAGDVLAGASTTDTHEVKNKAGHWELTCNAQLPANSHLPEQGVMQVGPASPKASQIGKGNKVADSRSCGVFFGGSTTNYTQVISSDGAVTLKCIS